MPIRAVAMDTAPKLEHKPIASSLSAGMVWIRKTRWPIGVIEVDDNPCVPSTPRRTVKAERQLTVSAM